MSKGWPFTNRQFGKLFKILQKDYAQYRISKSLHHVTNTW